MRKNYCLEKETVTECPIPGCGQLLYEGPGMTRKEKAIHRLKGGKNYRNLPKHICNHASMDPSYLLVSPPTWKEWLTRDGKGNVIEQSRQEAWIMEQAKLYLEYCKVEYVEVA